MGLLRVPSPEMDGGAVVPVARLCTRADIYDRLVAVLEERLFTGKSIRELTERIITYEDGAKVSSHEVDRNDSRTIVSNQPRHELRLGKIALSELGFIGKTSVLQLEGQIVMSFDSALERNRREQPACDWRLVAVLITQQNLRKTVAVPFTGQRWNEMNVFSHPGARADGNSDPVALNQKTDHVEMPDYRAVAVLVFADVARGALQDPHALHADGVENRGPMSTYRNTRNLFDLSASQQRHREQCERICAEFEAKQVQELEVVGGEEDNAGEVAELRRRVAELEARELEKATKPGRKKQPAIERMTPERIMPLDAAQRRIVVSLRTQGFNPTQIAKEIGVDVELVKEALDAAAQETATG